MSTALQTINDGHLTTAQVDLIKRTIAKDASNDELALFIATAKRLGLDPFARQIFAVKRWDADAGREVMSIQISIDGFRLIAARTGRYAPGRATEYETDQGQIVSATAYVQKLVNGEWLEVGETAYFNEYVQTKRDGKPIRAWAKMPRVMIAKCAEARALRRAFPAELSGVYSSEEMQQADSEQTQVVTAEIVVPVIEWQAMIDDATTLEGLAALKPTLAKLEGSDRSNARTAYKEREKQIKEEMELDVIAGRDAE